MQISQIFPLATLVALRLCARFLVDSSAKICVWFIEDSNIKHAACSIIKSKYLEMPNKENITSTALLILQ